MRGRNSAFRGWIGLAVRPGRELRVDTIEFPGPLSQVIFTKEHPIECRNVRCPDDFRGLSPGAA